MSARLHVLGAGSALPQPGYGPAGYVLEPGPDEPLTLLDCGPGSIRALGALGLDVARIERVVFTHYHLDHCLDLFALFFARHSPRLQPRRPLALHGPQGLAQLVAGAPGALGRWAADPQATVHEVVVDGTGRGGFAAGHLRFTCRANGHTPEAVSWRVERPGAFSLVFTGDTGFNPVVAELARDVDLFLCECSFPDGEGTDNHLTPSQAGQLARDARARRLVLTHFYPGLDPACALAGAARHFGGVIEAARDGLVLELP